MIANQKAEPSAVTHWRSRLQPVRALGYQTYALDEGEGEPVVLLHGIPTHSYLWRDVAERLTLERRVIAPDLLGFGFADRPGGEAVGVESQAEFISAMLHEMGIDRFALVVHDLGALVGAEIVRRAPGRVTQLAITNTSFELGDWVGHTPISPLKLLTIPGVGELAFAGARPTMLKLAFSTHIAEKRRLTDEMIELFWHPFEHGLANTLLDLWRSARPDEELFAAWRDALSRFEGESLVAWGMRDPSFGGNRGLEIAQLLPNSHLVEFRNSSHFIQEDRPLALGRLILALLGGHLRQDITVKREDPKAILIR